MPLPARKPADIARVLRPITSREAQERSARIVRRALGDMIDFRKDHNLGPFEETEIKEATNLARDLIRKPETEKELIRIGLSRPTVEKELDRLSAILGMRVRSEVLQRVFGEVREKRRMLEQKSQTSESARRKLVASIAELPLTDLQIGDVREYNGKVARLAREEQDLQSRILVLLAQAAQNGPRANKLRERAAQLARQRDSLQRKYLDIFAEEALKFNRY